MPPSYGNTSKLNLRKLLGGNKIKDIDAGFDALAEDIDSRLAIDIPQLLTATDVVPLMPVQQYVGLVPIGPSLEVFSNSQNASLCYLPRRIVGATRLRWGYAQDASTALTGNYVFGIYNTAGTKIVATASIAISGTNNSSQSRSETIAATTLEAGLYYVLFGVASFGGGGNIIAQGSRWSKAGGSWNAIEGSNPYAAPSVAPNLMLYSPTGGITAPANLLSMQDTYTDAVYPDKGGCPLTSLSVG